MRNAGIIEAVSLGMNDPSYRRAHVAGRKPNGTFDSKSCRPTPGIIDQDGAGLMALCQARGVKIHNAGIFASRLLVGGDHYKYEKAPPEILARREKWAALAKLAAFCPPRGGHCVRAGARVVEKAAVGVLRQRNARQRFVAGSGRGRKGCGPKRTTRCCLGCSRRRRAHAGRQQGTRGGRVDARDDGCDPRSFSFSICRKFDQTAKQVEKERPGARC